MPGTEIRYSRYDLELNALLTFSYLQYEHTQDCDSVSDVSGVLNGKVEQNAFCSNEFSIGYIVHRLSVVLLQKYFM